MRSRAWSSVTPLWARSAAYSAAKPSRRLLVAGSTRSAPETSTPRRAALARMVSFGPRSVSSGDASDQDGVGGQQDPVLGAFGQHDARPGDPGGVDQAVLEHQWCDRPLPGRGDRTEQRLGVQAALDHRHRGLQLAGGLGREAAAGGAEPGRRGHRAAVGRDDRHDHVEALDQPLHLRGEREPPVEDDAGEHREGLGPVREQHPEHDVLAVAGHDHHAAVDEPVEHVRHRHRGDDQAGALAVQPLGVAVDQPSVAGVHQVLDGRRPQQRGLRQGLHGHLHPGGHRGRGRLQELVVHLVGHDAGHVGVDPAGRGHRHLGHGGHVVGVVSLGRHDEQQPRTEVRRHRRVDRELGGRGDVGVVRPHDEDDVVVAGDVVEPVHDGAHRALG